MQMEDMTEAHEKQQDGNKVKHSLSLLIEDSCTGIFTTPHCDTIIWQVKLYFDF